MSQLIGTVSIINEFIFDDIFREPHSTFFIFCSISEQQQQQKNQQ